MGVYFIAHIHQPYYVSQVPYTVCMYIALEMMHYMHQYINQTATLKCQIQYQLDQAKCFFKDFILFLGFCFTNHHNHFFNFP